jgi:transcriptional antiterminator Rof (Rho-off)
MTDTKNHTAAAWGGSLQGRVFTPRSAQELADAIELAFDYRGDVTLELKSGEAICGYLFNRDVNDGRPWVELFPASSSGTRRLSYDEVATIAFSGEDTASGKSWEQWVAKKESERKLEAARIAADAKARGHL